MYGLSVHDISCEVHSLIGIHFQMFTQMLDMQIIEIQIWISKKDIF